MKNKFKLRGAVFLIGLILIISPDSFAQRVEKKWRKYISNSQGNSSNNVFSDSNYFQLGVEDSMLEYKSQTDQFGNLHIDYFQTYKGYRVEGADYILHYNRNELTNLNGSIVYDLNLDDSQLISEAMAINRALSDLLQKGIDTTGFKIQKPSGYIETNKDNNLQGSLVVGTFRNNSGNQLLFKLCYKFEVNLAESLKSAVYSVDAKTETILAVKSIWRSCGVGSATGTTNYNGTQSFTTELDGSKYRTQDPCRNIKTYKEGVAGGSDKTYKDSDDNWNDESYRDGVSAHWAMQRAFDYFETTFSYHLLNDTYGYQKVAVYIDKSIYNAYWNNNSILIGENDEDESFSTLDICSHEWTHGINVKEALIEYENESGALDESFADIFGVMVEYYVEGMHSGTYKIGEDVGPSDVRSLQNPTLSDPPQPSIYGGANWHDYNIDPDTDRGGVHINSGVQNHWFYLLAEGGSQTVDGTTYSVTSIGIENAAKVAFQNIRYYLTSTAEYSDAKNGSILAAIDLWGACDWKVAEVIKAWDAVGVSSVGGILYDDDIVCDLVVSAHTEGIGFYKSVVHNLTSDCTYELGETSNLRAGNEIKFLTGSVIRGGNFRAHIDPCVTFLARKKTVINHYEGIGNTSVVDGNKGETFAEEIRIYPNPASNRATIELPTSEEVKLSVLTLTGQEVLQLNVSASKISLKTDELENGVYLVNVTFPSGEIRTEKLIVNH